MIASAFLVLSFPEVAPATTIEFFCGERETVRSFMLDWGGRNAPEFCFARLPMFILL